MQLSEELDLFDFSLKSDAVIDRNLEGFSRQARAFGTRSRVQARRASSETTLSEILPADIADGESWHVMSSGDVDSLSYLAHLLRTHRMDYVALSTWCMALLDIAALNAWLSAGKIGHLDAYVGEIFPGTYASEHVALCNTVRAHGGRVAVFRNHSKIFLCRSGTRAWVIESSANINTNPRTENACITADMGLFLHHKAYFDSIRSFNRDFDDWSPVP